MGEIHSEVTLENTFDRGLVEGGYRNEADIRHATVDGIVDTGAVSRVLPPGVGHAQVDNPNDASITKYQTTAATVVAAAATVRIWRGVSSNAMATPQLTGIRRTPRRQ